MLLALAACRGCTKATLPAAAPGLSRAGRPPLQSRHPCAGRSARRPSVGAQGAPRHARRLQQTCSCTGRRGKGAAGVVGIWRAFDGLKWRERVRQWHKQPPLLTALSTLLVNVPAPHLCAMLTASSFPTTSHSPSHASTSTCRAGGSGSAALRPSFPGPLLELVSSASQLLPTVSSGLLLGLPLLLLALLVRKLLGGGSPRVTASGAQVSPSGTAPTAAPARHFEQGE